MVPKNVEFPSFLPWFRLGTVEYERGMGLVFFQWEFRNLNWRYLPYITPIFQALISGNIPTKYGQKYGTKLVPPGTFTYLHVLDPEDPYWFLIMSSWAKRLNLASSPIIESSPWSTAKPRLDLRQRTPEMLAALGNYGNISNHWRFS